MWIVGELRSSFWRGNESLQSVSTEKYSIILGNDQMCVCMVVLLKCCDPDCSASTWNLAALGCELSWILV